MNAQPQAQQAPAPVNQSGIAIMAATSLGPLTQQTQQPAPAPQGMQGLDPKLVAAMMAQYAKQKEAEMNARQMALQSPQPQGTVVDQLLAQQGQQPQAPAGIQQLMGAQRGNVAQAQGIDAAPTPQSFKEGGIVGFAEGGRPKDDDTAGGYYPLTGREGQRSFGDDVAEAISASFGRAKDDAKRVFKKKPNSMDLPPRAAMEDDPRRLDNARTWTGRALDPRQLAAANPEQAAPPAPAPSPAAPPTYNPAPQNQGSPGGITLALPQRPQPQAAPVEAFANKAMGRDPEAARNAEIARWRAEVGPMDTSANDELLRELRTRKNELAKRPEKGIAGLLDYAKNIAAASKPGNAWWQDMSQGAQHGEAIDEKRREQEMAAMREMLLAQQNGANAKRADRQAGYDVGLKAEDRISKRAETAAGIAGPMRNADRAAEASMHNAELAYKASVHSTDSHLKGVMEQVSMGLKSRAPDAIKHAMDNAQMLLKSYHEKLATYKDNFDVSNPKSAAGKDVAALRDKIDILGQTLINLDPVLKSAMPQMAAAPTTGKVLEAK